ncbi:beta-1,3-galactosyltransferase 5 [Culex quinquefasciatus]|uniref:beta-1,3-galactosyltransferase 5 n=1 Tax=Culex quinquefasciatus TaxID=7176 RepID=UPI0018E341B8|nr:beta-1,3-galactosyltransferase 5 [Culex quinquefasciatus]
MLERRPLFGALIGLTLVFTIWHMAVQESVVVSSNGVNGPYPEPVAVVTTWAELAGNQSWFSAPPGGMLLVNPADSLPKDDYSSLIDLKDFRFTINFNNCSSSSSRSRSKREDDADALGDSLKSDDRRSPLVLVLVHSAPTNWYKRNTIRDTWGRYDPRAKLVFLLGAVNSSVLQRRIEKENRLYDDIVQGSFLDAYRNMTYKHVMALKWFTYHCPEAKYILKADDDVFVNTPALYNVLSGLQTPRRRLLFCQEIWNAPVKRTHRSKWFVSIPEYRNKYYPNHCPGYSILYSPDVAYQLYREAMRQPYFWIDDVHITGTIAQRINVTITPTDAMLLNRTQKDAIVEGRANATDQLFFFTTPDLREGEIRKLWRAVTAAGGGGR